MPYLFKYLLPVLQYWSSSISVNENNNNKKRNCPLASFWVKVNKVKKVKYQNAAKYAKREKSK